MQTKATLYSETAKVYGSTDIWSHCEFGGITGISGVLLVNEDGTHIGSVMSPDSWGVDGKVEARLLGKQFERFGETWKAAVPDTEDLLLDHRIEAFNHHVPRQRLWDILNEGSRRARRLWTSSPRSSRSRSRPYNRRVDRSRALGARL